jgi:hypothetical protein
MVGAKRSAGLFKCKKGFQKLARAGVIQHNSLVGNKKAPIITGASQFTATRNRRRDETVS